MDTSKTTVRFKEHGSILINQWSALVPPRNTGFYT